MPHNPPDLTSSDFYYDSFGTTEDAFRYVPGGYHPIIVGDILGGSPQRQYRIIHKLGWGSYATVWLAQKVEDPSGFVAMKITTADNDSQAQEVEMLQKATEVQPNEESQSHVLKLLDNFTLRGPNGTHTVLVTDVVVPILSIRSTQHPPAWRKTVSYGLAQAMAHLHNTGVVHGDWHLGNAGVAMPQLGGQDPDDVMLDLGPHEVTLVLTSDIAKQTASLPAYLLASCNIAAYYRTIAGEATPQVKIFDFGSAHEIGKHPRSFQCAVEACAPESVSSRIFEKIDNPPLEPPADVWALGATIYEIVTGSVLFYGVGMSALPLRMSKLAGHLPQHWEKWTASLADEKISTEDADKWWTSRRTDLRKGCESEADTDALIQLLKKIFVLDPRERPTAAEILSEPWFRVVGSINPPAPAAGG